MMLIDASSLSEEALMYKRSFPCIIPWNNRLSICAAWIIILMYYINHFYIWLAISQTVWFVFISEVGQGRFEMREKKKKKKRNGVKPSFVICMITQTYAFSTYVHGMHENLYSKNPSVIIFMKKDNANFGLFFLVKEREKG